MYYPPSPHSGQPQYQQPGMQLYQQQQPPPMYQTHPMQMQIPVSWI